MGKSKKPQDELSFSSHGFLQNKDVVKLISTPARRGQWRPTPRRIRQGQVKQ